MQSLLSVLNFTTKILFPKYPHALFPLLSAIYISRQHKQKRKNMKLLQVPEELFSQLLPSKIKESLSDINAYVLVSLNVLEACDGIACPWVLIKNSCTYKPIDSTSYLVHAIGVPNIEDETLIVSEITFHNIKETVFATEKLEQYCVSVYAVPSNALAERRNFAPDFASSSSVALIQPPYDVSNSITDSALEEYFSVPRFLHPGDIFCVNIKKHAPHVYYLPGAHSIRDLYFKVTNIGNSSHKTHIPASVKVGYYILKGFTSIHQSANEHSYLPSQPNYYIDSGEPLTRGCLKTHLLSKCPSGLNNYFSEMVKLLNTFLEYDTTKLNIQPVFLVCGPQGSGRTELVRSVTELLGLNLWCVDCLEIQGTTPGQAEGKLKFVFSKMLQYLPCILLMKNIEVLGTDKDGKEDSRTISCFKEQLLEFFDSKKSFPGFVVATFNSKDDSLSNISPALTRLFLHIIRIQSPDKLQREAMLEWIVCRNQIKLDEDVSLEKVAAKSSGFLLADLKATVSQAIRNRYKDLTGKEESLSTSEKKCFLKMSDFKQALDVMHAAYSDAIGAPKIPAVSWSDVGGLADLKKEISRTITMPLQHPDLVACGLRRSGILLFGPPGTGKTLLAKAIATEYSLNFLSVKGPELLNMYVGQSEENVREVFSRARSASPCIIFFDELDSLAPNRGRSGDSGGVMDRVVSQLLAEMDGLQKSSHLFVIGATNRPDLIDPALLRPGRFDKLLYVGVCEDKPAQLNVMAALTRKFSLKEDVDLEKVVANFPPNLTGADLYSVCANAWLNAVKSRINNLQLGLTEDRESPVQVGLQDFLSAASSLTPSVSAEDLAYFRQLKEQLTSAYTW